LAAAAVAQDTTLTSTAAAAELVELHFLQFT
jgi:hypothetical protein